MKRSGFPDLLGNSIGGVLYSQCMCMYGHVESDGHMKQYTVGPHSGSGGVSRLCSRSGGNLLTKLISLIIICVYLLHFV